MKTALLLVAWGAGTPQARHGLGAFELLCRARFDMPARWAFTSELLRERLTRQQRKSDSVFKALQRLHYEGFDSVAIQPLQTIAGREYEGVVTAASQIEKDAGLLCKVGAPLLAANLDRVAMALTQHLPADRKDDEDVIFMGHGGRHCGMDSYAGLADALCRVDPRLHVGVMCGMPELEQILSGLGSRRIWLMPLLSTVGQHALRDMAGPDPDSWKSRVEAAGHECRPVLAGMVEISALADIWLDHLGHAITQVQENF